MLNTQFYLVLDGFAIIISLVLYMNLTEKHSLMLDEILFRCIIIANIAILFVDAMAWYIEGSTFSGAYALLILSNTSYYTLSCIFLYLCVIYISSRLNTKHTISKSFLITFSVPVIIDIVMSIATPITHWFFYIDSNNLYHRGNLYWVQAVIGIGFLIHSIAFTFQKALTTTQKVRRNECFVILSFTFFPLVCCLLQSQLYGLPLIWLGTTLTILIIFICAQNSQLTLDALTGLNNRGKFDLYLEEKVATVKSLNSLYLIVLDIDHFKEINDVYGHVEGDAALIAFANILQKICENGKDFAARYGGDEFTLVCLRTGEDDINPVLLDLEDMINRFNHASNKQYTLSVSYGYAKLDQKNKTVEDLKREADRYMYVHKQNKKKYARTDSSLS